MPISDFILTSGVTFTPETVATMGTAFEGAVYFLRIAQNDDRPDPRRRHPTVFCPGPRDGTARRRRRRQTLRACLTTRCGSRRARGRSGYSRTPE
jgi:hypothetical protein